MPFSEGATGKRVANCRTIIKGRGAIPFFVTSQTPRPSFSLLCACLMAIYRGHPPQESPFTRPCKLFDIAIRRYPSSPGKYRCPSDRSSETLNPFIGHWNSTYRNPPSDPRFLSNFSFTYIYIYSFHIFPLLPSSSSFHSFYFLRFNLSNPSPSIHTSVFRRASSRLIEPARPFILSFFLFFLLEPRLLLSARRADYTNAPLLLLLLLLRQMEMEISDKSDKLFVSASYSARSHRLSLPAPFPPTPPRK